MRTDIEEIFNRASSAKKRALFLDYDGTLAPFCIDRDKAFPYPGIRETLNLMISAGHTRLVIITGRYIKDLIQLLALDKTPEIFGSHGSERMLADGMYEGVFINDEAAIDFAKVDKWLDDNGYNDLLEVKPGCRAIHFRGVDKTYADDARVKILDFWSGITKEGHLESHEFNGGIELRLSGHNKGMAVSALLEEMGEEAFCVYLGDDVTDEDAFMAIKGKGVGILVKEEPRTTYADYTIRPPDELIEFLKKWDEVCKA